MSRKKPTLYGRTVYPKGMMIEIESPHEEWTDYAAEAVNAYEANQETIRRLLEAVRWTVAVLDGYEPPIDDEPADNFEKGYANLRAALCVAERSYDQ